MLEPKGQGYGASQSETRNAEDDNDRLLMNSHCHVSISAISISECSEPLYFCDKKGVMRKGGSGWLSERRRCNDLLVCNLIMEIYDTTLHDAHSLPPPRRLCFRRCSFVCLSVS